jgi:hypothetical protein
LAHKPMSVTYKNTGGVLNYWLKWLNY